MIPRKGSSVIYVVQPGERLRRRGLQQRHRRRSQRPLGTQYCCIMHCRMKSGSIFGAYYSLSAFQYLPRQDGCANGWINSTESISAQTGSIGARPWRPEVSTIPALSSNALGARQAESHARRRIPATSRATSGYAPCRRSMATPWTSHNGSSCARRYTAGPYLCLAGLDFPDQLLNTPSTPLPIALTNVGLSPSAVHRNKQLRRHYPDQQLRLGPSCRGHCVIDVTFTLQVHGYRSARLTVQNTASGIAEIPLSGNGVFLALRCFRRPLFSDRSYSIPPAPPQH